MVLGGEFERERECVCVGIEGSGFGWGWTGDGRLVDGYGSVGYLVHPVGCVAIWSFLKHERHDEIFLENSFL